MRIEVNRLNSEQDLVVKESIPAQSWDMDGYEVKFVDQIDLIATFKLIKSYVLVDIEVVTRKIITCVRCLNQVGQRVVSKYHLEYPLANLGKYLDVSESVREEILLDSPLKVVCNSDCQGISQLSFAKK